MKSYYQQVRASKTLRKAWNVIHANGDRSESLATRDEIANFAADEHLELGRIERQLRNGSFRFPPAHGIAIEKKGGKKKRPIVKSPIPSRIVQRAILDVVQRIPEIKTRLQLRRNFGGIEDLGVPEAIKDAYKASVTHGYYIRSDIKAFFDNVPRDRAIKIITDVTREPAFDALLKAATDTELDNLRELGRDGDLFPLQGVGVAQGSCLSPLLCNLLLEEFDATLNGRGVVCVRYIDDFILFAKDRRSAFKALANGRKLLATMGLDLYDPIESKDKADHGLCRDGMKFLGCEINPGRIRPSSASKVKLLGKLRKLFSGALGITRSPIDAIRTRKTYAETMLTAGNIVRGWGNTYSFCTDDRLMVSIDLQIDGALKDFNEQYKNALRHKSTEDRRRLLGVFLLADCNKDMEYRDLVASAGGVTVCGSTESSKQDWARSTRKTRKI